MIIIVPLGIKNAEFNYFDELKECEVTGDEIMYSLDELTIENHKKQKLPISVKMNDLIQIYSYKSDISKVN